MCIDIWNVGERCVLIFGMIGFEKGRVYEKKLILNN